MNSVEEGLFIEIKTPTLAKNNKSDKVVWGYAAGKAHRKAASVGMSFSLSPELL